MLTKPTKDEPAGTERLREFIQNDRARIDRLRTREAEQIVIKESRDSRHTDKCVALGHK